MADVILKDPLIQALMEQHILGSDQIADIEEEHVRTGKSIREIILNLELISEDDLLAVIAENLGTKVISLPALDITPDVVRSVPPSLARMYNVVPVQREANSVTVATFDMVNPAMMDELMFVLSQDVNFVLAREDDIRARVSEFYGDDSAAVNEMLTHLESDFESGEGVPEIANTDDSAAIEEAAFTARIVCIGYSGNEISFPTRLWVQKELDIMGSRNATPADFEAVIGYLRSGKFPLDEMITRIIQPEGAAEAFNEWSANPGKVMKILVSF